MVDNDFYQTKLHYCNTVVCTNGVVGEFNRKMVDSDSVECKLSFPSDLSP